MTNSPAVFSGSFEERVTVVVLTYNRGRELHRSLAKLTTLPGQPVIIVVDNGSPDDDTSRICAAFPQVKLLRAASNLGAAGRNLGVKHVRTPYVAFSDDDTWWEPGALRVAADILDAHPRIAVLNARILVGPEGREDSACLAMAQSPLEPIPGVGPALAGFMAGACVMRTSAYLQVGGYWDAFFIGGEEALFAMDILDSGKQIAYAPALCVHHWPSSSRDDALRRRLLARNAIWTAWMRLPVRLAFRYSVRCLGQTPRNLRWNVVADVLGGICAVLAKRRVLKPDICELLERVRSQKTC